MTTRRKKVPNYESMSVADIKKELAKASTLLDGVEKIQLKMLETMTTMIQSLNNNLNILVEQSKNTVRGIDDSLGTNYSISTLKGQQPNNYSASGNTPYNSQGLIDLTALHKNGNANIEESSSQTTEEEEEGPVEMKGFSNNNGTMPTVKGLDPLSYYNETGSDGKALKPQPADSNNPMNYANSSGASSPSQNNMYSTTSNTNDSQTNIFPPSLEEFIQMADEME